MRERLKGPRNNNQPLRIHSVLGGGDEPLPSGRQTQTVCSIVNRTVKSTNDNARCAARRAHAQQRVVQGEGHDRRRPLSPCQLMHFLWHDESSHRPPPAASACENSAVRRLHNKLYAVCVAFTMKTPQPFAYEISAPCGGFTSKSTHTINLAHPVCHGAP
jgi:hypothetical protein